MSSAALVAFGAVVAAVLQFGALGYWGGRISARLDALEQRIEALDTLTRRTA